MNSRAFFSATCLSVTPSDFQRSKGISAIRYRSKIISPRFLDFSVFSETTFLNLENHDALLP
jgi:hypothetical protein